MVACEAREEAVEGPGCSSPLSFQQFKLDLRGEYRERRGWEVGGGGGGAFRPRRHHDDTRRLWWSWGRRSAGGEDLLASPTHQRRASCSSLRLHLELRRRGRLGLVLGAAAFAAAVVVVPSEMHHRRCPAATGCPGDIRSGVVTHLNGGSRRMRRGLGGSRHPRSLLGGRLRGRGRAVWPSSRESQDIWIGRLGLCIRIRHTPCFADRGWGAFPFCRHARNITPPTAQAGCDLLFTTLPRPGTTPTPFFPATLCPSRPPAGSNVATNGHPRRRTGHF